MTLANAVRGDAWRLWTQLAQERLAEIHRIRAAKDRHCKALLRIRTCCTFSRDSSFLWTFPPFPTSLSGSRGFL